VDIKTEFLQEPIFPFLDFNFEGRAGYVVITPFDNEEVLSSVTDDVFHFEVVSAGVSGEDFVAWSFGSVDSNVENVVA
jgi:hypothetical protein